MKKFFLTVLYFLFLGCAPLPPEFENQSFVPRQDIVATSLFNDGVTFLKAGRFIDAEMRFRSAQVLFPKTENIRANLALALKGGQLYEDSIKIYKELIRENSKLTDYRVALADAYFRNKNFTEARKLFDETMLEYEALGEALKASAVARTVSSILFHRGDQQGAFCYSLLAVAYSGSQGEALSHAKLLVGLARPNEALLILEPIFAATPDLKDIIILKLAALARYGAGEVEEAQKLVDLMVEISNSASEKDSELQILEELIGSKEVLEEGEEPEEEEELSVVLNPAALLYWPINLVQKYQEFLAAQEET